MNSRTYCLILLAPVLGIATIALFLLWFNQPQEGDLGRVGGFVERYYGWNQPQHVFTEDTVVFEKTLASAHGHYDMVVLGDSFSHFLPPRLFRWQQYIATSARWSVLTVHIDRVWLDDFLASAIYKKDPPGVVVLEFVERNLQVFVKKGRVAECETAPENDTPALALANYPVQEKELQRRTGLTSLDEALNFLQQRVKRKNLVREYSLTNNALFSSARPDRLLVIGQDQGKYKLSEAQVQGVGCYLKNMQQRIEANGKTRFLVIVPPDKTSVYCPYIKARPGLQCAGILDKLAVPGLHLLRLDRDMAAALSAGVVDLYLPNDTHWGYRGSKLAAEAVRGWLQHTRDQ
jgi:hypothetical protein